MQFYFICAKLLQLCLTICDPMDCSLGCSVHGIFQARILEWVAVPSSRGSSWPRGQTHREASSLPLGFPGGSESKKFACNEGDLGLISRLGRSPGGGHANPLQYSCLENHHEQRSLAGYSPWGQRVGHDWVTKQSTERAASWEAPTL